MKWSAKLTLAQAQFRVPHPSCHVTEKSIISGLNAESVQLSIGLYENMEVMHCVDVNSYKNESFARLSLVVDPRTHPPSHKNLFLAYDRGKPHGSSTFCSHLEQINSSP